MPFDLDEAQEACTVCGGGLSIRSSLPQGAASSASEASTQLPAGGCRRQVLGKHDPLKTALTMRSGIQQSAPEASLNRKALARMVIQLAERQQPLCICECCSDGKRDDPAKRYGHGGSKIIESSPPSPVVAPVVDATQGISRGCGTLEAKRAGRDAWLISKGHGEMFLKAPRRLVFPGLRTGWSDAPEDILGLVFEVLVGNSAHNRRAGDGSVSSQALRLVCKHWCKAHDDRVTNLTMRSLPPFPIFWRFANLGALELGGTGRHVVALAEARALHTLRMPGSDPALASAAGVAVLASLTALTRLDLACSTGAGPRLGGGSLGPALACLTRLRALNLSGMEMTSEGTAALHPLGGSLRQLSLRGCPGVDDEVLSATTLALPRLTALDLRGCELVTDAGLAAAAAGGRLRRLVRADLGDVCGITDAGAAALARACPDLTELDLGGCELVTDAALLSLATGPLPLTWLSLERCGEVTDASLATLGHRLPLLRTLVLRECDVTDVGLRELSAGGLRNSLAALNIIMCRRVTDEGVAWLARLPRLTQLDLAGCEAVTEVGLASLSRARLTGLTALNLQMCHMVCDAGVAELALIPSLESLNLGGSAVTDAGLGQLAKLPNLTALNLTTCTHLTDVSLKRLSNGALQGKLRALSLFGNYRFTDDGVGALGRLSRLSSLDLYGCCGVSDSCLEILAQSPGLTGSLRDLNLGSCHRITDEGVRSLPSFQRLHRLNLLRCSITGKALLSLCPLKHLRVLAVCSVVNDIRMVAAVRALKMSVPGLHVEVEAVSKGASQT